MTWKRLRWVASCGLVLFLGLAGGCTNSDDLSSNVGPMVVRVELTNPSSRFTQAGFLLQQITVRPLDSNASDALGNQPLGILALPTGGIDVDYNGTATKFETTTVLTVGRYRLESVNLLNPIFESGTSASPATCQEYLTGYPRVSIPIWLSDFGRDVILDVTETGSELHIVIDGGILLAAYQNSWTCRANCVVPPRIVPWCIQPFNQNQFNLSNFVVQTPTYVQFP